MLRKTLILLSGMVIALASHIHAQLPGYIDETMLELRVKQIDEFMRRFNFDTTYDGKTPTDSADRNERLKNMYTVFRLDNFRNGSGELDSLMTDFCNYMIDRGIRLEYENDNWIAEVVCNATLDGKKRKVSLFLQPEQISDIRYKWVLTDADADFLRTDDKSGKTSLFISPAEHGISFITLPRIINLDVSEINTIFKKDWSPDNLSVLSYLIANKKLVLSSVNKVTYHWDIGDYTFDVERFEGENSPNQGWLVSNITKNIKNPTK
ncbi:MAG: hypothetical protein HDS44_03030 [Bacteroides sp.]|nr:hypothetical protein [Bacteroides sp.]